MSARCRNMCYLLSGDTDRMTLLQQNDAKPVRDDSTGSLY